MKLQRNPIKNCRAKKRERLFLEIWWLARSAHVEDSESELVRERERVREIRLNPKNLGLKARRDWTWYLLYYTKMRARGGRVYWAEYVIYGPTGPRCYCSQHSPLDYHS